LNGSIGQNGEFIVGSPSTCCNGTAGLGGNGANGVGAAGGTGETAANYLNNGGSNKNQPRGSNGIRSSGAGGAGGHGGSTLNTTPNGGRTSGVGGNGGYDGSSYNATGANQANGSGTLVWDFYNQTTPSPVAAGTSGSNGGNGSAGQSFAPNNTPTAYQLLNYFVPGNGQNGGDGFGGAGGAGGGGAGSAIVDGTNGVPSFTHVLRGSGGGAGGSGGQGGQGGQGGNGGGASFGIYVATNSVAGATFQAVNVSATGTAGTGGAGGTGGTGGVGGQGGQGGAIVQDVVNNVTLLSQAGNGGNGGIGGNGGRGQDGDNGITQAIYFGGNTPPAQSSPAANGVVTVNGLKGCTNSVISITKTSGDNWGLLSGGNFVNDISSSSSSFTNATNPVDVFYSAVGWKNINVGATTLNDYVFIRQVRDLPVITSAPFNNICVGSTVNLTTSATGQQYLWEIALASAPQTPVLTFTSKDVNNVTISTAGTYQVKLQVEETCCGWSVPVYATLVVDPLPATIASISGTTSVCVGETAVYSVNFAANAAPNTNSTTGYKWVIPAGASVISSGGLDGVNSGGSNSITITYGSSGGTLFVTPSNDCGNGQTTSTAITIKSSPTGIVFSGNTSICVGASATITAVANGGSGGYSYLWSNSANTNIINVSPTINTNYAVTATASNGCSIASNVNVTVISPQAPTLNAETNVTGGGFTANWNAATSATAYFLDVATDNSFTNFVAGYNNLNVGNVLTYNVSGLSPNQTYYYRLRTAIGSCISPNSVTGIVNTTGLVWNGNVDTDWFDENNWTPAIVPTATFRCHDTCRQTSIRIIDNVLATSRS
jgi:hypothetical protein